MKRSIHEIVEDIRETEGETDLQRIVGQMNEIVAGLVIRNIGAGCSVEEAKDKAFNRLDKEFSSVLNFWLESTA